MRKILVIFLFLAGVLSQAEEYNFDALSPEEKYQAGLIFYEGIPYKERSYFQNYEVARMFLERSARENHLESQYLLGGMYHQGLGMKPSMKYAIYWYEQAALQGSLKTKLKLANMYYEGEDIEKDYELSSKWLERAFRNGDEEAGRKLAYMYIDGKARIEDLTTTRKPEETTKKRRSFRDHKDIKLQ